MKNITLSADEHLIERARRKARSRNTTLNAEFRMWLERYSRDEDERRRRLAQYHELMERLSRVSSGGRRFSRDEMNER